MLLTGGTGKVGRRLTTLLAKTSVPTFQASRTGETTTEPDASNVKAVAFDWNDETTWTTALAKSQPQSVYLVAPPFLDMLPPMRKFIDLARSKAVKRFILLSGSPLHPDENGIAIGRVHAYLKKLGDAGEVEWASLRPTWFSGKLSLFTMHPVAHVF